MVIIKSSNCTRRFHAYCVGTPKSGTHSIAGLLSNYNSQHEPAREEYMNLALLFNRSKINLHYLAKFIRDIDNNLCLEMNSSNLNELFIDQLVSEFPKAKFILTIRDCYSWIDSYINNQLYWKVSSCWMQIRNLRFKPELFSHSIHERILEQNIR